MTLYVTMVTPSHIINIKMSSKETKNASMDASYMSSY